jgi:hypothetical protein
MVIVAGIETTWILDMNASVRLAAGAIVWAIMLWAALQLAHVHTAWDHALCGVWGCGPTLSAVISCHLAWLVALAPVALAGQYMLPRHWRRSIGVWLSVLVVAVLLGVVAREAATWLRQYPEEYRAYFAGRCLFVIATWVDVPLVEAGLLSVLWWAAPGGAPHEELASIPTNSLSAGDLQPVEIVNTHDYFHK